MKKFNLIVMLFAIVTLSGCASTFTSIESTDNPDVYYVTEVHQRIFVPPAASLFKCTADDMKMDCEEVGN